MARKGEKVLVVCGPTASGKSGLADELADRIGESTGRRVPVVVVDSMQVYEGLEKITNQSRKRPADLVGVVPVTERWTVARHRDATRRIISEPVNSGSGVVLDAGTGMYLNAIILDMPMAPRVPEEVRRKAESSSSGEIDPRRAARRKELEMVEAKPVGSIWDGSLFYDTRIFYLRPDRTDLDASIGRRSKTIAREGPHEAEKLRQMVEAGADVNPSVLDSVGVRELMAHLSGVLSPEQAEERIAARTRRLARRQMRWFDKLARTLADRTEVLVARDPEEGLVLHTMHDTMGS